MKKVLVYALVFIFTVGIAAVNIKMDKKRQKLRQQRKKRKLKLKRTLLRRKKL